MLVLLDSNILLSALISAEGNPAVIVDPWRPGYFRLLTCQQQIDEIREASRYPRLRERLQPHRVGSMLNNLYAATIWLEPIPRVHNAADPGDSYLLDLVDAAQPDYAVTGDKRSGLLQRERLGRTRFLKASDFRTHVLRI
jgi:uncharacterized protein